MNIVSDLAFFVVLARQPSLAAAAQEMGITPPNVSRRLAALERRLGLRLLNRTTRRLSLTAEGQRYLDEGERILQDLEGLEQALTAGRETPRGLLRVNAALQVILKPRNACLDLLVTGAALLCGDKAL